MAFRLANKSTSAFRELRSDLESQYSLRNGEYIDIPENRVFLSTKQQYRMVIDSNYVDYNK